MNTNLLQSAVRLVLGAIAGWLVQHGVSQTDLTPGLLEGIVGAMVAAISLAWSKRHQTQLINQPPPPKP